MGIQLKLRPPSSTWRQIELGLFIVLLTMLLLRIGSHPPSALDQLTFREELRVALVERTLGRSELAPGSGYDQLERELLQGFAQSLGVRLRVIRVDDAASAHRLLHTRRADLAAGLLIAPDDPRIEPGPEILSVRHVLVFHDENGTAPRSLLDLPAGVRLGATIQAPMLPSVAIGIQEAGEDPAPDTPQSQTSDYPPGNPDVERVPYPNSEALVEALKQGEIDYAILNSLEYRRWRRVHPELRPAAELDHAAEATWLFPVGFDRSLIEAAEAYLDALRERRELEFLADRYLGHLEIHNVVDALTFSRRVEDRLDRYRPLFEETGERHGLDWRFIAAVAYQESHWDEAAISPTGVRGLMMLTLDTAAGLNIEDRTDPAASVDGGTRYLMQLHERLSRDIAEPDRTWMTLAAYNVGLGHLNDARRLAAANGDDPNRWLDVMGWLPRLSEPEWHAQTRYGAARGWEPVHYVQNIRSYYDKLVQRFPHVDDQPSRPPSSTLYRRTPLAL